MASMNNKIIHVKPLIIDDDIKPQVRNNKKHSLKFIADIILSTCVDTTTHGIAPIIRRDNLVIRLVWLVCLIASAGVCGYMIALTIMDYLDFDTVSKTSKIHQIKTDFPAVTICNANPFLTNNSIDYVNSILIKNNLLNPNNITGTFYDLNVDDFAFMRYVAVTNSLDPNRTDSFRQSLGPSISDMLLSCSFNLQSCSADDFWWFFDTFNGNCFIFNSGKYANGSVSPLKQSSKIGSINGLKFELFVYEPIDLSSLSSSNGVRIVMHNQSHLPGFDEGMFVSVGSETFIEVSRTFSKRLEEPYSDCSSNIDSSHSSKFVRQILATDYEYTQQTCYYVCFQYFLIKECDCFDFTSVLPITTFTSQNITPCLSVNELRCDSTKFIEFFESKKQSFCGDDCPLECESVKYNLFSSNADYPTRSYASALVNNQNIKNKYASNLYDLTFESLKRNMLSLSIFYGDLGYEEYEESAKTEILDVISNFGGTLGLFLGMSFLSLVEIVDILLQICFFKHDSAKVSNI